MRHPRPTRRSLRPVRRRNRVDDALMSGDDRALVHAATQMLAAAMLRLKGDRRRQAALLVVKQAEAINEEVDGDGAPE